MLSVPSAVFLTDLLVYDPASNSWTELTKSVTGKYPGLETVTPDFGFAAAGGRVYLFVGHDTTWSQSSGESA